VADQLVPEDPIKQTDNISVNGHAEPIDLEDAVHSKRIPQAVVKRLSLYSRALQNLERQKVEKISSTDLAKLLELNSSQVRKDLAYFGQFGVPGFGYPVKELRQNLKEILGTDKEVGVALIGVGHLGKALCSYGGFAKQGFKLHCAFDVSVQGDKVGPDDIPVFHIDELEEKISKYQLSFAILTIPQESAQAVTDRLVDCGISAILNFVPTRIKVPDSVKVHYVDLALEMETLSFYLQ